MEVVGFHNVDQTDLALRTAIFHQPVSVGINANNGFQLYTGGVYTGECDANINFAVTAVGYGVEAG